MAAARKAHVILYKAGRSLRKSRIPWKLTVQYTGLYTYKGSYSHTL